MLRLENVTKTYRTPGETLNALDDVSLHIRPGEFVVIRGPSGSGKTTLLMTLAGMQRPTCGAVLFDNRDLYRMTAAQRARFRAENIGFVFQMFHLVPYLNVVENVLLPAAAANIPDAASRASELIEKLGLASRRRHNPTQLSAGEKQRAAVARAMLNRPRLILADEPTGNLDPDNARAVLAHLADYHKTGAAVVLVTHGVEAAQYTDRVIHLHAGRILTC
ncbi:MAG TPA: ABC transporter ATP-binding protein [Anaerohalosphaeraceae bacterium]|jgi:ABC-type lipoprotein export system ATPase subunit|nr:ABC transporter ATP-binding protein [Anaerohalosphaeraceae bacterium]HRT50028.1 ABC transporter ATP-binding protein [Anaerohalosphaeraceae bacterium]HRT85831.1 ABC transporter ATP-binding protein [Anaerohalosphaeraceae bacterium]